MDKRFEHTLHKEEHRIRHEKLLNLQAISEIKIKPTMNYYFIPIRFTWYKVRLQQVLVRIRARVTLTHC